MATSCIAFAVATGSCAVVSGRAEVKPAAKVNVEAVPISVVVSRLSFNCCSSSSSSSRRSSRRSLRSTTVSVYASEIEDEELASGGIVEPSGEGSDEELVSPVTTDADDPLNLNAIAPPEVSEGSKLYVGNLPWTCDSQQLAEVFQDCGSVELVEVLFRNLFLFPLQYKVDTYMYTHILNCLLIQCSPDILWLDC